MKTYVWTVLKIAAAAALIAAVAFSVSGEKTVQSDTPFQTVLQAVTAASGEEHMQRGEARMLRRLYGLDPADYEELALFYPETNMDAQEILLVKLRDPADREKLVSAAEARIRTQLGVFEGYGAEQTAMLKNCAAVEAPGNYFLFIVNPNAEAAVRAFYEVL